MTSVADLPLNAGQQAAADAFFAFLLSDAKEFGIDGPGGTGKSFLMSHLIDKVMPRYHEMCALLGQEQKYQSVEMTALTNKAAEVLAQFTQRDVNTIQSFMNLKVFDDYATGETKLVKANNFKVHHDLIMFVDECSMEDGPLDQVIQEGTHNCKIVYVGDKYQMAPVKEALSPLYRPNRMQWASLTEQMRTNVPEIQKLHEQLRRTVETGVFEPIKIIPGIIDHFDDNQMPAWIGQTFGTQTHDHRILAYTNKRVLAYNDYIRQLRGLPHEYTVGEELVNNGAIRLGRTMLSVEAEVKILDLGPEQLQYVDTNDDGSIVELRYCNAKIQKSSGGIFENVPLPLDRAHFAALVAHYKKAKKWGPYYELRNKFPDLRQRDAATVYKAQGSSYDSCAVDLGDISTCHNPKQVARMLYVALSRERKHIVLYGNLAEKYGGLVK